MIDLINCYPKYVFNCYQHLFVEEIACRYVATAIAIAN